MKRFGALLLALMLISAPALAFEYPEGTLFRGITGHDEEVEFLQYQLFYAGYLGDDIAQVDGIFGKKTEEAVKAFQRDHGAEANGIADPYILSLLDEIWESSMEPQGGAEASACCYTAYFATDTASVVLCEKHLSLSDQAAELLSDARDDAAAIEALQGGIVIWQDELNALYDQWCADAPEETALIRAVQETFWDHYRASMALWNVHDGSPSMAALEKGRDMLFRHCIDMCVSLGSES